MGQFIWTSINENEGRWKEGIRFLHHVLVVNQKNPEVVKKTMSALAHMYHNLHQDLARAAFWWQKAGEITPQWFIAPLSGDLHLTPAATRALDAGMLVPDITEDFDKERRPDGLRPDLGADELKSADADFDTIPDRAEIAPAPYRPGIDDRMIDSDSDGANNTHEYYAGTDPLNPGSILKLLEPVLRDAEFAFKVPTKTGWRFDIQYTELNAPLQWRTVSTIDGNGSVLEVTDAIQPGGRAYRVQTQPLSSN